METEFEIFTQGAAVRPRPLTGEDDPDVLITLHALWPSETLYVAAGVMVEQPTVDILHHGLRHPQRVILESSDGRPFMVRYEGETTSQPFVISSCWLTLVPENPDPNDDACLC